MNSIRVNKQELLIVLKKNRENHLTEFEKAAQGYRAFVTAELEKRLESLKNGKRISLHFSLQEPFNQTKDYDRVIRMLEMDKNDTIELSEHDFATYVEDDWSWKNQFVTSNALYNNN